MTFSDIDLDQFNRALHADRQLRAFCVPSASVTFSIRCKDLDEKILLVMCKGIISASRGSEAVTFALTATSDVWARFFTSTPELG